MAGEVAAFAGAVDAGVVLTEDGEVELEVGLMACDILAFPGEQISIPPMRRL